VDLRGPTSKGREWKEEKWKGGKNRYKGEGKGKKGKGKWEGEEGRGKRRCAVGIFNYFRLWVIISDVSCMHFHTGYL